MSFTEISSLKREEKKKEFTKSAEDKYSYDYKEKPHYIYYTSEGGIFKTICGWASTEDKDFPSLIGDSLIMDLSNEMKEIMKSIEIIKYKLDELGDRLTFIESHISQEDDVIEIKDYSYDEARKIIENYLIEEDREVDPFEIITKFGIDLHLIQKIYTDLVYEGKAE